ncbi:MAG TPA: hypothetical protein VGV38_03425, partial [Pyrinomonadaceae bacterium]|nr:hypothetical protein [Pyrinomonadaceae bacterium]
GADGALRQRWSFAYDARGNRTSWEFQVPGASTSGRYVLTYDAAGRKVKEEEFTDGRLETVRTFDRKEREVEAVFFLPDGSVHRRDLRRYRGNAVEWLTYEPDGKLSGRARYLYDAKGRLLRHVSYGDDGKPSSVETYAYDAHGNESQASYADGALESRTAVRASEGGRKRSEVVYGPGGSVLHETTYVRKLDAHGNWVRETAYKHFVQGGRKFFGPVEVTERFISYY